MRIERTYEFQAGVDAVWELLMDPTAWKECIPGCDRLEAVAEDEYEVTLALGIGAIRGTFRGTARISDRNKPTSYALLIDGRGLPGFVRGEARLTLEAKNGSTAVSVAGDAQIGGTLAAVGQRVLQGVAGHMMDSFFHCVQRQLPR